MDLKPSDDFNITIGIQCTNKLCSKTVYLMLHISDILPRSVATNYSPKMKQYK